MARADPKKRLTGKAAVMNKAGRLVVFVLAGVAVVCSVVIAQTCNYFEMTNTDDAPSDSLPRPWNETPTDETIQIGILGYERDDTDGECRRYEFNFNPDHSSNVDPVVFIAQFSAIEAPCFGLIGWLGNLGESIFWFTTKPTNCCYYSYVICAASLVIAGITQLLTLFIFMQSGFCMYDSAQECSMKTGAVLTIFASVLYWISAVVLICLPRSYACCSRRLYFKNKRKEEEEEMKIRDEVQRRRVELESQRSPQQPLVRHGSDDPSSISQWTESDEEIEEVRPPKKPKSGKSQSSKSNKSKSSKSQISKSKSNKPKSRKKASKNRPAKTNLSESA